MKKTKEQDDFENKLIEEIEAEEEEKSESDNKNTIKSMDSFLPEEMPLGYDKLLLHCQNQINESLRFVTPKRTQFRDRMKLYDNQKKQKDKLGDTLLFDFIDTAMSIYYSDERKVRFSGRNASQASKGRATDQIAEFDYEEMGMEQIDYLTQWDRLFYGVGIKILTEWDSEKKCPVPTSVDALSWLPDPKGSITPESFRYHGFEVQYSKADFKCEDNSFFNTKSLGQKLIGDEAQQTRNSIQDAANLGDSSQITGVYDMIDLFTSVYDEKNDCIKKFLVTLDAKRTGIYRCYYLEPVKKVEKKDPSKVPFPISLHYLSPKRGNPFGTSIPDLCEDKQKAIAILKNLRIAAVKAGIYPMYLYNRDMIKNKRDLDFDFNKAIGVSAGVDGNVSMAVAPLNKAPNAQISITDEQLLRRDAEGSTGISNIVQGMPTQGDKTLGEIQQLQANSNIRSLLKIIVNNWGEKQFWALWYRSYQEHRPDEKEIRIKSYLGDKFFVIKADDFITESDPDITIVSKFNLDGKKQAAKNSMAQVYGIITADPTKPLISKRFMERKLLRLNDFEEEEISIISPKTYDEIRAANENQLLERNKKVAVDMEKEDHLTHIIVHSSCKDTSTLQAHILKHWNAYYESGQADRDVKLKQMANENMAMNGNPLINNNPVNDRAVNNPSNQSPTQQQ